MSLFKMKRGQESKVSSLTKEDGSLIFSLNGANDSTVRLDQTVNGTVQRLGIAVDKAKDSNAVIDYNDPNRRIQIGYANAGLTTSNLTHVAGYTNDGKQIKDVSKDVLKSWLGVSDSDLGSYQKRYRNANTITTGGTDLNGTLPPAIFAYKNGYPLHTDPEFANSNNGINIYNNSGNGNVTIERIAMENGNSSGYVLKVSNKGSASPGLGGWYFGDTTVHARQYTCIFRAKIPAGRNVQWASNPIGTNGTSFWLTDRAGTGKWEWYAYHVDCGSANFSSTNYFYIDGKVGTASAPVVWYLSYANTIINSWGNYDGLKTRYSDLATNSNALGGSSLKNITDAINNSTASASSKFLPLAGGNMTGNIGYAGSKATYSMIKFIDNKADTYGNGIAIGGGGLTIIGGGESAATIAAQHSSGGDENMVVANDDSIDFYTNCQNGFTSAKHITMNTDGSVTASTFNGFATNSDKLDGYHENSFLRYRNATSTAGKNTLWDQIGIQEYDNCYPDGLTNGIYSYGEVISLPSNSARFDLWVNHNSSNQISNGLQYRSGWGNDKKSWRMILDSVNYINYAAKKNSYNSASISNATIKLGRSDGSTGTTLTVNNVSHATSADNAKLISPFENATANVSRNVWFSDSAIRNKACYNDNFKYNPVSQELTAIATTSKYTKGGESESNYQLNSTNLHATIDLSGSTYDVNTWYPVVGSSIPYRGYSRITCYVQLNSGVKPPWASHSSGFTCNLDVLAKASGWGTTNAGSIVLDYSYYWCNSGEPNPLSYCQLNNASVPVIWMRGGGKYFIRTSEEFTWSVKTSSYTTSQQTVAPSTVCPSLSLTRSTIYADINGSITGGAANASSAIFSTYAAYPLGFQSRATSATWGNTTGTFLTGWHTSSGGDIAFMDNSPSSGKVSMKLDGYFYQNEGANRVLDTSDAANYVKKAGDTMTGLLTLKTSNQQGIKLGSAWMTAASDTNGEFVLQGGHLRFGGSAWDYNQWAGLKYDHNKKYIYLGLADGTIFTANSAQSGGSLLTPGISNIYVGGTTQTRVITSSDIDDYVKKSGDTMTGALNFANSTWNKVGDDVKIGDHNIAGSLGVIGANGQTRIDWCQYGNASKYQGIVYDGTKLATSGTFKADYFDGVAKDSQALAGSTLAQIIEAAGGVITITKNLKPTVDWLDTGIAGTALSTGTYIVQVSGLSSGNTPGIYSEIWSGVFSWYSGGTNSTNSDEILLHNAGHADNSNELYLRTIRQGATSGGVMKLQMAVKQASTSTVDVTFKFRKMI